MEYTITNNKQFNSVEISFNEKPAAEIRDALKALKFRWHSVKKVWYGYTDPDTVRAALNGTNAKTPTPAPIAPLKKGTPQDHIKIYWNGIKIDGGKLLKCIYYIDKDSQALTISGVYIDLPRDLLPVTNDSDSYTDYYDDDHATITAEHPLYKYFLCAFKKCERRDAERNVKYYEKKVKTGYPSLRDYYQDELTKARADLESLQNIDDPGQPTQEDLEQIDKERQEAENKRREEEHKQQLEERERVLREQHDGKEYINRIAAKYPIKDGEPVVNIPFSENPAFYSFMIEDQKMITLQPDGTKTEEITQKMPRCVLSVTAADIVLNHFDRIEAAKNCGYDKTDFIITGKDENGEDINYTGRYDLGDNDGGLIEHIRAVGEWYRTHEFNGKIKDTPDETNDKLKFVEYLEQFIEEDRIGQIIPMF